VVNPPRRIDHSRGSSVTAINKVSGAHRVLANGTDVLGTFDFAIDGHKAIFS
jgi:hypothetical protein